MINTRALTFASPSDANLRTGQDTLGMLRGGNYDSNRSSFFHNTKLLNNRTAGMISAEEKQSISDVGIISFPVPTTETPNHPIPFKNALTDAPIVPYDLYHSPLAPQFNPIAVTTDFVKK